MAENGPVDLSSDELESTIENNSALVLDFWAEWCAPCKTIEPVMEDLAEKHGKEIFFGKVNVEEEKDAARNYGVSSIPNVLFIKDGEVIDRIVGAVPKNEIEKKIEDLK
ncbi:MAG: thioredoxin [Candidatus Hadarchaeia archaeon]